MNPLIESYYQSISLLQDKEEIIKELPESNYDNFDLIMNNLIDRLNSEKNILLKEKDKFTKKEYQELIIPEINILDEKINLCHSKLEEVKKEDLEIEKLEELSKTESHKELIFATTPRGNICIEEDIKSIPQEFYERIYNCLNDIEIDAPNGNTAKNRIFTNNKKLEGLSERKTYQVRVIYRYLTKDTVYIELAKTKKSDNNKDDREEIINRNDLTKDEYDYLKKDMKDEELKKQIIEQNRIIKQRIIELLEKSKGEAKHGKN